MANVLERSKREYIVSASISIVSQYTGWLFYRP